MRERSVVLALLALLAVRLDAQPVTRRALLIGINDYSASRLSGPPRGAVADREWSNLDGAVNDVRLMRDLLVSVHGFRTTDIVTLTDQQATHDGILSAIEQHLVRPASRGDVVFFFFSGHGSQVANSRSTETDRLDESLVPADSRLGAKDIRDKELHSAFSRILDRGARLTVVIDSCHSGSGVRGFDSGLKYRAVLADPRDVADASPDTSPEDRGAVVISATQDFDLAFETMDETRTIRGAFTWALARAIRDAAPGEPVRDTFIRARALLHAERPAQDPVLAARPDAAARPFLGRRRDRRDDRVVAAIEKVTGRGTYRLDAGWANGITTGSELRVAGRTDVRLEVTALDGITRSEARITRGQEVLRPGTLVELVTWAAPPSPPLRVWMPRGARDAAVRARAIRDEATRRGICWIEDPTQATPTHLLRWRGETWELISNNKRIAVGVDAIAAIPSGASLYVHVPAPPDIAGAIEPVDGIEWTQGPENADYVLAGRLAGHRLSFAWVRPFVTASDRSRSLLPLRSAWVDPKDAAVALRDALQRLRLVHGWHELRAPAATTPQYRLGIRRARDGSLVDDGTLVGNDPYRLVLRRRDPALPERPRPTFVYAFVIDSHGNSVLLFPPPSRGAVENLLPRPELSGNAPDEIPLTSTRSFLITEPYGIDTYFLLSTEEPLLSLTGLAWRGVRAPSAAAQKSPLDELIALTLAGTRGPGQSIRTPATWAIEKAVFESVPPRRTAR
jgi:hypothetical protein